MEWTWWGRLTYGIGMMSACWTGWPNYSTWLCYWDDSLDCRGRHWLMILLQNYKTICNAAKAADVFQLQLWLSLWVVGNRQLSFLKAGWQLNSEKCEKQIEYIDVVEQKLCLWPCWAQIWPLFWNICCFSGLCARIWPNSWRFFTNFL